MTAFDPPVQNLDAFDVVGVRKDGGVDLVVSCSGPLDDSTDTLSRLGQKVRNYLREIASEHFRDRWGDGKVAIYLSCAHSVSADARKLVSLLEEEAAFQDVRLQLVDKVG